MKYTDDQLREAVSRSSSVLGVMRELGIGGASGGTHAHIKRRIKLAGIDTSHFLGRSHSKGKKSWARKASSEVLIRSQSLEKRVRPIQLRNALIESGRAYACESCGIVEWRGLAITLQVDHKNGDWQDNRPENLRFMCPNCHSQTSNWCGRKAH